jgi:choice-of-anchor B domain-containing protein
VEVSDPYNPVYLGNLAKTEGATNSVWRDIKVYKDHAYIVADGAGQHGMQVFDLHRLLDVPDAPVEFDADVMYDQIASAHNIVINEETGFAYSVASRMGGITCGGGLHMKERVATERAIRMMHNVSSIVVRMVSTMAKKSVSDPMKPHCLLLM